MKKLDFSIPAVALLFVATPCLANTSFTTNFTAEEGYTSGGIDQSVQTGAANFNEQFNSQFYLPGNTSPGYGTVRRNPTGNGANATYKVGDGADFAAGDSWTVSLDFTFEGLVNTAPASATTIMQLGFSTSATAISNNMFASIQKGTGQTEVYQLIIFGQSGGGFASSNFSYAAVGDDTANADDLTDLLRLEFTITETATAGTYSTLANLYNLDVDSSSTIASSSATLVRDNTADVDLFGYFKANMGNEADNFDLFNIDAFSYDAIAVPEPATYSFLLGSLALVGASMRRKSVLGK
jgi:hypothetical protein